MNCTKGMENNHFSQILTVFYDRMTPEEGYLAGYGAIINTYELQVPLPDKQGKGHLSERVK
ncbi:hypothetical protein GCM10023143_13930 [Compostibacter hankyongensis]|uniref:Uncharacterized protein n=1 Tax=Compostibacter hankyongensis TaxID=1007089 RepID=A0ABP8FMU4_9BACT